MKIAISGKGGVGKSTIAGILCVMLAKQGGRVLALDADPDANLAASLGITKEEQDKIISISKQIELIEERTGAKVGQYGQVFKLNPDVADVADNYAYTKNGVALLVLGAIKAGGSGCACPESSFAKALVTDLVLYKNDTLIMDMEAGIEHLGRGTSSGVDVMLVVVEPGQRSIDCANTIYKMAKEIGIKKVKFVANEITDKKDEDFVKTALKDKDVIAYIPYSDVIKNADRDGVCVADCLEGELKEKFVKLLEEVTR